MDVKKQPNKQTNKQTKKTANNIDTIFGKCQRHHLLVNANVILDTYVNNTSPIKSRFRRYALVSLCFACFAIETISKNNV